jgi:hypothetical protein
MRLPVRAVPISKGQLPLHRHQDGRGALKRLIEPRPEIVRFIRSKATRFERDHAKQAFSWRYVLGQAGQVAARADADLRRLYSAIMHRHGRAKAKVAVARKLLVRLYIMLRDQIDYDEFRARSRPRHCASPRSPCAPDVLGR